MPTHVYENWNKRPSDREEQIEPYRKYYFICEGANTETFYFKRLIDIRKDLNIHPLIDVRLLEKTEQDRNLSFPKRLAEFAEQQKAILGGDFDEERDRMVIIFDADIFEEKVSGYEEFVADIETRNIVGVTNPGFELFLCYIWREHTKNLSWEMMKSF
ncbi:MAG: RloB family protein [Fusicatenibacter sp.]|nr:RloB family protein [Fusicatenibacter sp.]